MERMVIHDVELVCSFYNLVVTAYLFFLMALNLFLVFPLDSFLAFKSKK